MMAKVLIAGAVLMVLLSSAPLPSSEQGTFPLAPGEVWSLSFELGNSAHVTCLVRSNGPVEVSVIRESGSGETIISSAEATSLYRFTETLEEGRYRLVITNQADGETGIEYQVHRDYLVVANMTAKNVMALSLALAIAITTLILTLRARRT